MTNTMKPAVQAAWLKDLRSGDFTQGQYTLRQATSTGIAYCCLGVLAERLHESFPEELAAAKTEFRELENGRIGLTDEFGNVEEGTLPGLLLDRLGIPRNEQSGLVELNDNQGATFSQIADHIEENIQ